MEASAKKSRRLPEAILVAPPPPQSMVGPPMMIQPFPFQPPPSQQERKRSMPAAPIYHFYQQQIQQQQQRLPSPTPPPRRVKRVEDFPDNERETAPPPPWAAAPPMALPVSLTMPLHAVPPYAAMASSAPPGPGPVRRVGSKRAAPSPPGEEWRFANGMGVGGGGGGGGGGGSIPFVASPPPPPPPAGFLVSPASFAGPINVSVAGGTSQRVAIANPRASNSSISTPANPVNPARAAAIEKRKSKLKQVSAAYHMEMQSQCQKLLILQRECRDGECATAREHFAAV